MARNYISGKINIPEGPIPGVGGLDQLEMADTQNFTFGDNELLYFGDGPDASISWDATNLAMALAVGGFYITAAHGTVSGGAEKHSVDIVSGATLGSGCGLVGLNIAVTPNGGATNLGVWRAALYGKVTLAGGTGGQGYMDVAELELVTSNAGGLVPDHCVLCLAYSASHTNPGSCAPHASYIWFRSYGTQVVKGLMTFFEDTRTAVPGTDTGLLSAVGAVAGRSPYDTAIRFFIGSTPYWLMASSTGPASIADEKIVGTAAANYMEWDASADRLNVVVASRAVTGEEHAVDISYSPTLTSGDQCVGLNIAVTPDGGATNLGTWRAALYGKVTIAGGTAGQGYVDAAELEFISSNAGALVPDHCVLSLAYNASHTNPGSCAPHSAYIWLRDYGTTSPKALMNFMDATLGAHDSGQILVESTAIPAVDDNNWVCVRCMYGTTVFWLVGTLTAPS